jgi:hypothetical protein
LDFVSGVSGGGEVAVDEEGIGDIQGQRLEGVIDRERISA